MFWFFRKNVEKEEFEQHKHGVQTGFNSVKQDISNLSNWIKHLNSNNSELKNEISVVNDDLSTIKDDIKNLKNLISMAENTRLFKQRPTTFNKQTTVYGVLNSVQTGVQTAFFSNLTPSERAIIIVLLNSDMKLSYEDLAAMLGKRKSTIRGQINSIRQKSEGLIEEVIGENNKKRVYIPEKAKELLLKTRNVRANKKEGK
ncbi:MAG: hypothetical protein AABW90_03895 [Nanoarchaeota archaeon]